MRKLRIDSTIWTKQSTNISLLIILLAFSPGVFMESFWSDDYNSLMNRNEVVDLLLSDARPALAISIIFGFSLISGPGDAWILRGLALAAMIFLFLLIAKGIDKSRQRSFGIFSIAISFCLPSFQMYIHWAWPLMWAALASLLAFRFWATGTVPRKILGILLLVFALTNYPPTALFYFSAIAVINVLNRSSTSKIIKETIQGLYLLAISVVISIMVVATTLRLVHVHPTGRVRLISIDEMPEKILWLLTRPITIGLRPFMIDSPAPWFALVTAIPALVIIFFGIKAQAQTPNESTILRGFSIVFLLILTLLPLMITPENQIEFRMISGYCWGITSLVVYFILTMIDQWFVTANIKSRLRVVIPLIIPITLSFVCIFTVNTHYFELFNNSYRQKTTFLETKISKCFNTSGVKEVFIFPPKLPFPSLNRLGIFSMSTDLYSGWVAKPNVELILQQRGSRAIVRYLDVRPAGLDFTGENCIIDLEEFRKILIETPTR
jgi:hypothetical protein